MIRILLVITLSVGAAGASAANWLAQDAPQKPLDYCTGLVVGGLASRDMAGVSRTDLWLAWSYVIQSGGLSHPTDSAGFQSGKELFNDKLDAATQQAALDDADGSCGLGRSGHQVVGW